MTKLVVSEVIMTGVWQGLTLACPHPCVEVTAPGYSGSVWNTFLDARPNNREWQARCFRGQLLHVELDDAISVIEELEGASRTYKAAVAGEAAFILWLLRTLPLFPTVT